MLLQPTAVHLLERSRHLLVQTDSLWSDHLLVEGLTEEGVCETIGHCCAHRGTLLNGGSFVRLGEQRDELVVREARHSLQHVNTEVPPDNRGNGKASIALGTEPREALADNVSKALR